MTGDEVQEIRKALGLSRIQFARALHCSYHSVSNYEKYGIDPDKDNNLTTAVYTRLARKAERGEAVPEDLAQALRGQSALKALRLLLAWIDGDSEEAESSPESHYSAGSPPYGYAIKHKGERRGLVLDLGEQKVLGMIKTLHEQGYRDEYIAEKLNKEGHSPRRQALWTPKSVRNIRQRAPSLYDRFLVGNPADFDPMSTQGAENG